MGGLELKCCQYTWCQGKKMDAETHTGQQWTEDDIRSARFMHRTKQVNPAWSMDLAAKIPIIEVNTKVVACDGGGGALGHPRIFINLDGPEPRECIYCQQKYRYNASAKYSGLELPNIRALRDEK